MNEVVLTIADLEVVLREAKKLQDANPDMFTDAIAFTRKRVSTKYGEADMAGASLMPKQAARLPESVFKNY
jgi:hypothetical protein